MYIIKYSVFFVCCNSLLLLLWLKCHCSRVANLHIHFKLCSKCGYRNMEFNTYHRYTSFSVTVWNGNIFYESLHAGYYEVLTVLNYIKMLMFDCSRIKCLQSENGTIAYLACNVKWMYDYKERHIFRFSAVPQHIKMNPCIAVLYVGCSSKCYCYGHNI